MAATGIVLAGMSLIGLLGYALYGRAMSFAQEPRVYFAKVLWGVMGLLLAVPLTAFIKLVADLYRPCFTCPTCWS